MRWSGQLPRSSLIELSRALRHNLGAGLTLRDVMRQLAGRCSASLRPVVERIAAQLARGRSLEEALANEAAVFPPLFIDLAVVGERTGKLPEVFAELENYYQMQDRLARQFRAQIFLPVVQFFLAVLVIAGMMFVLGSIAEGRKARDLDPLGVGLQGKSGAVIFLAGTFGLIGLGIAAYYFLSRTLRRKALVDRVLLKLPLIGPCLEAFALGRFTLTLRLTLETGMSIREALRLSLRATSNAAYAAQTPVVLDALKAGDDLALALAKSGIFPIDFQNILAVAEEGGRIPEVMKQQAEHYHEEASRRLTALTRGASIGVWLLYAVFMVLVIFRIAGWYLEKIATAPG